MNKKERWEIDIAHRAVSLLLQLNLLIAIAYALEYLEWDVCEHEMQNQVN